MGALYEYLIRVYSIESLCQSLLKNLIPSSAKMLMSSETKTLRNARKYFTQKYLHL